MSEPSKVHSCTKILLCLSLIRHELPHMQLPGCLLTNKQVEFTPIFMTSNRSLERVIASTHPHDRACEHTALLEQTQVMNVIRVLIV